MDDTRVLVRRDTSDKLKEISAKRKTNGEFNKSMIDILAEVINALHKKEMKK